MSVGHLRVKVLRATNLAEGDPSVTVTYGSQVQRSTEKTAEKNPVWNENFTLEVPLPATAPGKLALALNDGRSGTSIGSGEVALNKLQQGAPKWEMVPLPGGGKLFLEIEAVDFSSGKLAGPPAAPPVAETAPPPAPVVAPPAPPPEPVRIPPPVHTATLKARVLRASGLQKGDIIGAVDPYVVLSVVKNGQRGSSHRTSTKKGQVNPVWNEEFALAVTPVEGGPPPEQLEVEVFDDDVLTKDDLLGKGKIMLYGLHPGSPTTHTLPLSKGGNVVLELLPVGFSTPPDPHPQPPPPVNVVPATPALPPPRPEPMQPFRPTTTLPPGTLNVRVLNAPGLRATGLGTEPYVQLRVHDSEHRTRPVRGSASPSWNEDFDFQIPPASDGLLHLAVRDRDGLGRDDVLGQGTLHLADLPRGGYPQRLAVPLGPGAGTLNLEVQVTDGRPTFSPLRPSTDSRRTYPRYRSNYAGSPVRSHQEFSPSPVVPQTPPPPSTGKTYRVRILSATNIPMQYNGAHPTDPVVLLKVDGENPQHTHSVKTGERDPVWNEEFLVQPRANGQLIVEVGHRGGAGCGAGSVPLDHLQPGQPQQAVVRLEGNGNLYLEVEALPPGASHFPRSNTISPAQFLPSTLGHSQFPQAPQSYPPAQNYNNAQLPPREESPRRRPRRSHRHRDKAYRPVWRRGDHDPYSEGSDSEVSYEEIDEWRSQKYSPRYETVRLHSPPRQHDIYPQAPQHVVYAQVPTVAAVQAPYQPYAPTYSVHPQEASHTWQATQPASYGQRPATSDWYREVADWYQDVSEWYKTANSARFH